MQRLLVLAGILVTAISVVCAQTDSIRSQQMAAQVAVLIESLQKTPGKPDLQNDARSLGIELLRERNYQSAADLFIALRKAVPTDRATLYGGALALFNVQRLEEAEEWVRTVIDQPPPAANVITTSGAKSFASTPDALVLLGIILAVKGDNAGSIEVLSRAVRFEPQNFDAQFALGRARYGAGDPAGAAREFRAAVALRPKDAQAHFFLCSALEKAGDDAAAVAAYREFISIAPNAALAHLGIGVLLAKRGAAEQAEGIRELEKAIALDDKLYEAHITLGRTLIRNGKASASIPHLNRAAELAPENPEPHYQLAIAYRRLGRKAEAETEEAKVKQIHETRRGPRVSNP